MSKVSNKNRTIDKLIHTLTDIRSYLLACEEAYQNKFENLHPYYQSSAKNLIHYLALRTFDLREVQEQLSSLGLSSIGHSERYTLVNINNVLHLLKLLNQQESELEQHFSMDYPKSKKRLETHATQLLGKRPIGSRTRIMVTMPTEAASNTKLVNKLLEEGMTCARINCSHDSIFEWEKMIKRIRKASNKKGIPCKIHMDLGGPKLRTGFIKPKKGKSSNKRTAIILKEGDQLHLYKKNIFGQSPVYNKKGNLLRPSRISTTLPAIFDDIKVGESIWFDDGKIGGEIVEILPDYCVIEITQAAKKGSKLKAEKGINLPDTDLSLPALTETDLAQLPFILQHADMVGYSFVRTAADVAQLQEKLKEHGREDIGIILKIETWDAFQNLPAILLQAMQSPCIGIMIARGDLAVEVGWERISEIQEEILWLCEAAHIPTIWATQILENLAKYGLPTRSEITDAAMAARAECAMLNKGPYISKAIKSLKKITRRMVAHQRKKMGTLRILQVAEDFFAK